MSKHKDTKKTVNERIRRAGMDSGTAKYLDQNGASAYTGIKPRTFEAFRLRGGGPVYFKVGRRVMYSVEELDKWMESLRRKSTSDPGNR